MPEVLPPLDQPAALGLGLCDIRNLLTPEQQAELYKDLADLARLRREAYAAARDTVLH